MTPLPPNSANVRNVVDYYQPGDTDWTQAFRRACQSEGTLTEIVQTIVYVPPSQTPYMISDTIYVRLGCVIQGPGYTLAEVRGSAGLANKPMFRLGIGRVAGAEIEDTVAIPGFGPAPEVRDMYITATAGGTIGVRTTGVGGWAIQRCWFRCPVGIEAGSSGGLISSCVNDGGHVFIDVTGYLIRIVACESFNAYFDIRFVASDVKDIVVSGCLFYSSRTTSVLFSGGASSGIRNVLFSGCSFAGRTDILDTGPAYPFPDTPDHAFVRYDSAATGVRFTGCTFRASIRAAVYCPLGGSGDHGYIGCHFMGDPPVAARQARSGNVGVEYRSSASVQIVGCRFDTFGGSPVILQNTSSLQLIGNAFENGFTRGTPSLEANKVMVLLDAVGDDNTIIGNRTSSTQLYVVGICASGTMQSSGNRSRYSTADVFLGINGSASVEERGADNGAFQTIRDTLNGRRIFSLPAIPRGGSYNPGDLIYHSSPVAGGNVGWVYVGGSQRGWKAFGSIAL